MLRALLPLIALAGCSAAPAALPDSNVASPTVIELYQSQGCSSCPPALVVLDSLADRRDVIALNFAVTYWDRLGWPDRFAKPQYTARQWDYARTAGRPKVQTPHLIVNGRGAVLGSRKAEAEAAIVQFRRTGREPVIAAQGDALSIAAYPGRRGQLWIADYDPRRVEVAIRAGENGGRTLGHRNIVRNLVKLGEWDGGTARFVAQPRAPGLVRVALIQQGVGGPILAAKRL